MVKYVSRNLIPGVNDLKSLYPALAKEWDKEKNKELGIDINNVTQGSGKKVHWKCNKCGHQYMAIIANRTHGSGCPECAKKRPHKNKVEVSLFVLKPEVAKLYSDENIKRSDEVPITSNLVAKWECPSCHYKWENRIARQVRDKNGCPKCHENKLKSVIDNIKLDPKEEYYNSFPVNALVYLIGKERLDKLSSKEIMDIAEKIGNKNMSILNCRSRGLTLRETGESVGLSYESVRIIENELKKEYSFLHNH